MIPVSRPLVGKGAHHQAPQMYRYPRARRPSGRTGTPRVSVPLPVLAPGGRPFAGMDPSDPLTYVRPWNPAPGMIGYLNYNGAAMQGSTDTGTRSNPASWNMPVGGRPARRPR